MTTLGPTTGEAFDPSRLADLFCARLDNLIFNYLREHPRLTKHQLAGMLDEVRSRLEREAREESKR